MQSTTVTGRMENSTELVLSSGLMAQCTKGSGSTADNKAGVNSLVKKGLYTKENGLRVSITAEAHYRLLQAKSTPADGKMESS